jgi:hypothetical protein
MPVTGRSFAISWAFASDGWPSRNARKSIRTRPWSAARTCGSNGCETGTSSSGGSAVTAGVARLFCSSRSAA